MPTDIMSIITAISAFVIVIASVVYLFSIVRRNDMKLLRDSNADLRNAMDDGKKKTTGLENAVHILEEKVGNLEKRNKTLEELVVVALKQYFLENPIIASTISEAVKP